MGDDGGFTPPITLLREAMDLLDKAVASCGYTGKIKYAIDSAASEFFREDGLYDVGLKNDKPHLMSSAEMRHLYSQVMDKYPIVLLEDPFAEDDWDTWTEFNKTCKIELVGDDLLCTNVDRLYIAHERKACNSMLLKVNQIGSVTEAIEA
jgi:enolase